LRIEGENFFVSASGFEGGLFSLGGGELGLRAGGLRADIGVVEFEERLSFADVVAFFHEDALDAGGEGSVGFEVLDGLDLSIGGDEGANGSAYDRRAVYAKSATTGEDGDEQGGGGDSGDEPVQAAAGGRSVRIVVARCQPFIFQGETGISISNNLPPGALGINWKFQVPVLS
jgi:hypothetical protein